MNQMTLYAKVVTVRDKQLQENKELEREWLDEQKRLDLMMEIERLKSLKAEDEREQLRVQAQRKGAEVIIEQIKEREVIRQREAEQREREQAQMLRNIEIQREADLREAEKKKAKNAQMLAEVEVSNKVALDRKTQKEREEREEDLKIVQYNAMQVAKEQAAAEESRRIKEEKEKEI